MKRIAKSLLGGFIVSIVLAVIFPSAFLKDDALWTYKNRFGRIDVAFAGDVSDGQIEVRGGKEVQVDRPRWLLNEKNNQGVMVFFPVSYLKKSYQMTLTPRGNAKEISLVMRFLSAHLPPPARAWVRFENVRLDERPIAQEEVVWCDQPFTYRYQNVKNGQNLTLNFDIQKPFSFTGIRWERLVGLFIVCTFFIFYYFDTFEWMCKRVLEFFYKRDILQDMLVVYANIDVVYRRSFWIIFGVLCFAFGFHAVQFMWGNHDWNFVGEFISFPWHGRPWEGRWAIFLFRNCFLGGGYLPLIFDVITFLFLALNAVLLCIYWKLEKRVVYFVLCGLILTAQPFTLSLIYFVHMLPETFIGVTSILIALMLAEKIAFEKSSCMRKVVFSLLSIILINLSLAMYPVLINTIAVVFVGRLLVESLHWDGSWKQFKDQFIPFSIPAICIALGIGLYKLIVTFVFPAVRNSYNTQTLPLEQLPDRLWTLFKQCFHQLYEYPFPFISQGVLWIFLGFTILIALYICLTGNFKQKIVRLPLLGGALFATQTVMMVANCHVIAGRIELFGLVFFETLMVVLVFTKIKKLHNLGILAGTGVVWVSIINDLDCLRVWKLGFDAEKMLWNRVLARMEKQKDFYTNKKYKIIQIGKPISLRPRFHEKMNPSKRFHDNGDSLLSLGFDASWDLFLAYEFYYQTEFRGEKPPRPDRPNDPKYKVQLKRLWEAGILDKARAWPHENGLVVWEDIILFVTDAKLLEEYKKQLAQEFPRQSRETQ